MKKIVLFFCMLLIAHTALAGSGDNASSAADSPKMLTTEDLERRYGSSTKDDEDGSSRGYLASHKEEIIRNWLNKTVFTNQPGVESQQLRCGVVQSVAEQADDSDKARVNCGYRASGYYAPGKCCKSVSGDVTLYYYDQWDVRVEGNVY